MTAHIEEVAIRPLAGDREYQAGFELQREIWGPMPEEVTPGMLRLTQLVGGVAAGGFLPAVEAGGEARLVALLYGMSGFWEGEPAHWSHLLGVRPEVRGLGVGRRMKLYQREFLLALGISTVLWTFDPLEARNGHLNLNRLGAEVEDYLVDYYGGGISRRHAGIGTDRFRVVWRLESERVRAAIAGDSPPESNRTDQLSEGAPLLTLGDAPDAPDASDAPEAGDSLPAAPRVRVAVPAEIQSLKRTSPERAIAWRRHTRRALQHYLERGYRVERLLPVDDGRSSYLLVAPAAGGET